MVLNLMSPEIARAQRAADAERRRDRQDLVLSALGHPAGRAFLDARLAQEVRRLEFREGDSHAALTHQLGRVSLLRDLAAELARASAPDTTTPGG